MAAEGGIIESADTRNEVHSVDWGSVILSYQDSNRLDVLDTYHQEEERNADVDNGTERKHRPHELRPGKVKCQRNGLDLPVHHEKNHTYHYGDNDGWNLRREFLKRHCPKKHDHHKPVDLRLLHRCFKEPDPEAEKHAAYHSQHYGYGDSVHNLLDEARHRENEGHDTYDDICSNSFRQRKIGKKLCQQYCARNTVSDNKRDSVAQSHKHRGEAPKTVQSQQPRYSLAVSEATRFSGCQNDDTRSQGTEQGCNQSGTNAGRVGVFQELHEA